MQPLKTRKDNTYARSQYNYIQNVKLYITMTICYSYIAQPQVNYNNIDAGLFVMCHQVGRSPL